MEIGLQDEMSNIGKVLIELKTSGCTEAQILNVCKFCKWKIVYLYKFIHIYRDVKDVDKAKDILSRSLLSREVMYAVYQPWDYEHVLFYGTRRQIKEYLGLGRTKLTYSRTFGPSFKYNGWYFVRSDVKLKTFPNTQVFNDL